MTDAERVRAQAEYQRAYNTGTADTPPFAEDAWPRTPIVDALPANWKMVKLHLKLALQATDVEEKDGNILKETEHQIQQALWYLRPPAAE